MGQKVVRCNRNRTDNSLFKILVILCLFVSLVSSCENPFMEKVLGLKTITFDTNGGTGVPEQKLIKGEKIIKPGEPAKSGYIFFGWYIDNETFIEEWDFSVVPENDIILYAKWEEVIITGLSAIELKQNPKLTYTHGELLDISELIINLIFDDGEVIAVPFNEFNSRAIKTNPENGTQLSYLLHNNNPVEIIYYGFNIYTNPLIISKAVISNAAITLYGPATGENPDMNASGSGNFIIDSVSWNPNDDIFLGGIEYTVTVILSVIDNNYVFAGFDNFSAVINGEAAIVSANTETTVTISYKFNPTLLKAVSSIVIVQEPDNLNFVHGDIFNLNGLVLRLIYNDGDSEEISAAEFNAFNIDTEPEVGIVLNYGSSAHNKKVKIKFGHHETETEHYLLISKAGGAAVTVPVAELDLQEPKITITMTSALVTNTGQNIEYAIYNGTTLSAYGTSTTFENLSAGIYRIYARSSENNNYNAGTPSVSEPVYVSPLTFTISIEDITNGNITTVIPSGLIISRSNTGYFKTTNISISNSGISSIRWYYDNNLINTGTSIELAVSNNPQETTAYTVPYNIIGKHLLTVVVTIGGVDYSRRIEFEVRQ